MLIGSDDLLNVSVGRLPATKHTYNLQKEAFRSSVTSPFMSNGFFGRPRHNWCAKRGSRWRYDNGPQGWGE
jgi:hypothetical protein